MIKTTLHEQHTFCTFLCLRCLATTRKFLISRFMEDANSKQRFPIFFFLLKTKTSRSHLCLATDKTRYSFAQTRPITVQNLPSQQRYSCQLHLLIIMCQPETHWFLGTSHSHTSNMVLERAVGWEALAFDTSPHSWIFTSVAVASSFLLIHFRYGPNILFTLQKSVAQNLSDMWHVTLYLWSAWRSFAPLQKPCRNHRCYVWTETLSCIILVAVGKLSAQ